MRSLGRLVQSQAIASTGHAGPPRGELLPKVIRRHDAIGVDEQQVRRRCRADALVPRPRLLEALVRMRDDFEPEADFAPDVADNVGRLIARAVVDDDDLELPIDAALGGERQQAAAQMRRPLECGNDDRDFRSRRQVAAPRECSMQASGDDSEIREPGEGDSALRSGNPSSAMIPLC